MFDLDGVSFAGCLLASILNEAASPYAGFDRREGTSYTEGLLLGSVVGTQGTATEDAHERIHTLHREAALTGYVRSPERCGFYDALGGIDERRLAELVPAGERLAGFFVVRKGGSTRPSLRELEAFRGLAASASMSGQPPVLLVACLRLLEGAPTQSFQYQCLVAQGGRRGDRDQGRLNVVSCRINNLTMDSSAEYSLARPAPIVALGMKGAQQSVLEETFGPVPPPHVCEAEALLDTGIQTMEALVSELKAAENDVVRLQVENACMERILSKRDPQRT